MRITCLPHVFFSALTPDASMTSFQIPANCGEGQSQGEREREREREKMHRSTPGEKKNKVLKALPQSAK